MFCMVEPLFATQPQFSLEQLQQFYSVAKDPLLQQKLQLMIALLQGKDIGVLVPIQSGAFQAPHLHTDYKPTYSKDPVIVNVAVTNKSEFERSRLSLSALPSEIRRILELTLLLITLYSMYKLFGYKDDILKKISDCWEAFKDLFPKINLPGCFSFLKYLDCLKLPKSLDFLKMLRYPNPEGSIISNSGAEQEQSKSDLLKSAQSDTEKPQINPVAPQQLKTPEAEKLAKELTTLVEELQKEVQKQEVSLGAQVEEQQKRLQGQDLAAQKRVFEYKQELKKAMRKLNEAQDTAQAHKVEHLQQIAALKDKFFDLANKPSPADEEQEEEEEADKESESDKNSKADQPDASASLPFDPYHGVDFVVEAGEEDRDKHFEKARVGIQKESDVYEHEEQEFFQDVLGGEFDANEKLLTYEDLVLEEDENESLFDTELQENISVDRDAAECSSDIRIDDLKKMFEDKAQKLQGLEQKMGDALKKEKDQAQTLEFVDAEIESRKKQLEKTDQKLEELEKNVDAITNKKFVRVDVNLDMPFKAMLVGRNGDLNDDVDFTINIPLIDAASMPFSVGKTYFYFEEAFYEGGASSQQPKKIAGVNYLIENYLIQPASELSNFTVVTERNDMGVLYYVIVRVKDNKKIYFLKKSQCSNGTAILSRLVLLDGKKHRFVLKFNKSLDLVIERILVEESRPS